MRYNICMAQFYVHESRSRHPARVARRKKHVRISWYTILTILIASIVLLLLGRLEGVHWQTLSFALFQSIYRITFAYILAFLIGVSIALIVGTGKISDILFPIFDVLQNIPSFALIPIFAYFFGYTDFMIIIFAATSIVWPILFAVLSATRGAKEELNDAAYIFGARGFKKITHYLAPLSYPAMITGSIIGIAIGWEAVIGAEIIGNAGGFGAFIDMATKYGITAEVYAGTIGILLLVFILNRLIWSPLLSQNRHHYA